MNKKNLQIWVNIDKNTDRRQKETACIREKYDVRTSQNDSDICLIRDFVMKSILTFDKFFRYMPVKKLFSIIFESTCLIFKYFKSWK